MNDKISAQNASLVKALEREEHAARKLTSTIAGVRACSENSDILGLRKGLEDVREDFDEFSRAATQRNMAVAMYATRLGLPREATLKDVLDSIEGDCQELSQPAKELYISVNEAAKELGALKLIARYSSAFLKNIIELYLPGNGSAGYGPKGYREVGNLERLKKLA